MLKKYCDLLYYNCFLIVFFFWKNKTLLRLDGIAFTGAEITPYYDSLLGKVSLVASLVQVIINLDKFLHLTVVLKISLIFFPYICQYLQNWNQQQTVAAIKNESSQIHLNSRQKDYSRATRRFMMLFWLSCGSDCICLDFSLPPFYFIQFLSACFQFLLFY